MKDGHHTNLSIQVPSKPPISWRRQRTRVWGECDPAWSSTERASAPRTRRATLSCMTSRKRSTTQSSRHCKVWRLWSCHCSIFNVMSSFHRWASQPCDCRCGRRFETESFARVCRVPETSFEERTGVGRGTHGKRYVTESRLRLLVYSWMSWMSNYGRSLLLFGNISIRVWH